MTILKDDVILPVSNKLSLLNPNSRNVQALHNPRHLKRKSSSIEDSSSAKRHNFGDMLNGYRSNDLRGASDTLQGCPIATLSNMGNTCFLNSVLYTLRFAPSFLHNLHHLIGDLAIVGSRLNQQKAKSSSLGRNVSAITGPSARSTSSKDLLSLGTSSDIIPKSKVQIVTEKLHELFMIMHNLELKESTDAYQPAAFLQAVREANYIFEGNHQQDAHELLVYLLDNIRETCDLLAQQIQDNPELLNETEVQPATNNSTFWNVRYSWKKSNKKKDKSSKEPINEEQVNGTSATDNEETNSIDGSSENFKKKFGYNFVAEDFEGITLRRTKCSECECVTERKEPFYDIPVPINVKEDDCSTTPSEIYRKACVTSEKLCDGNKYLCENCMRYNEASREVSFERLPNIMVLQLKRFTTTLAGVQKINSYVPTPLEMNCFCESCCCSGDSPTHRYQLCCVIMHLGGTMASGHYIAYVKATNHQDDYADCPRDVLRGTLSGSSSEKSLNILKFLKPRALSGAAIDSKNGLPSKGHLPNGIRMCKSAECCGIRLNRNIIENIVNSENDYWQSAIKEDVWLECDDDTIKPISSQEFQDLLSRKPNSTSTPYLLFYNKITDTIADE